MNATAPQYRGCLPILGLLSLIAIVAIVAYECGRYHRSLAEMVYAVRVRWIYVTRQEPVYRAAEPDHCGVRRDH